MPQCGRPQSVYLVARLLTIVDLLEGDGLWGEEVAQLGQVDAVAQPLLQLCGRGQLLVQTCLHPSAHGRQRAEQSGLTEEHDLPPPAILHTRRMMSDK